MGQIDRGGAPLVEDGLSCVLVARDDRHLICPTLQMLVQALDREVAGGKTISRYEIVVVDDGSADDTAEQVQAIRREAPQVKLIRHLRPEGYSAAVHDGLVSARFGWILLAEAGIQYDAAQIRQILAQMPGGDLVTGYRTVRDDPLVRKLNAWGWSLLVHLFFGPLSRDIDCPLKLFRRAPLDRVDLIHLRGKGAIANTEILVRLQRHHPRHVELPVRLFPSSSGKWGGSGVGVIPRALWELAKLHLRLTAEGLGWLGFVTGAFSRMDRPMEVTRYRRSMYLSEEEESIACPLCGADADALRRSHLRTCEDNLHLGDFSVLYCSRCRNAFTHPRLALADSILEADVPWSDLSFVERRLLHLFVQIRVQRVLAALGRRPAPAVLEIGSGSCAFANALVRAGARVTVVEPNEKNARFADPTVQFIPEFFSRELVHQGALAGRRFDAVVMWHSLEHQPHPRETLRLVRHLLEPDGTLYLCVPNIDSLQAETGQNFWAYLDVPHHVSHFTMVGLVALLRDLGFGHFRAHFYSVEYDTFGFYQTLLNLVSRSHNYYYNVRKKRRQTVEYLRHPGWTKLVTALGFLWLPLAAVLSFYGAAIGKPACIELYCRPGDVDSPAEGKYL
ncbi:MAG: methyltransferase domain-containing protein [Chloroflexi bacterium]|nr:methyltransferase domain-containing protein [Chloroflexota bacterium]